jgi:hypothetical protein
MKTATTYQNLNANREMGNWADYAFTGTLEHTADDCGLEFYKDKPKEMN